MQLGMGYMISSALGVAIKLDIFEHLQPSPTPAETIAKRVHADGEATYRLLRALAMAGITEEVPGQGFRSTELSRLLRKDDPESMRDMVEFLTDPLHFELYGHLRTGVVTGKTVFDQVYGQPAFEYFFRPENREEGEVFNAAMTSFSYACLPAFLEAYEFSRFSHIVDVAGGHGAILRTILKKCPHVKGTVAEIPAVLSGAKAAIASDGLAERCAAVECDFLESVPAGGDCYFMKHIIHDWADPIAEQILKNIRQVIPANGKVVLAEAVILPGNEPHMAKLLDLEMLVFVGGKERTEEQFRSLFAKSGFRLDRVIPTKSPLSLIEASPA